MVQTAAWWCVRCQSLPRSLSLTIPQYYSFLFLCFSVLGAPFFDGYVPFHQLEVHTHQLTATERPRLSSFLVLLLSGCICFITSLCSKWIPGTEGRFGASQQQKQDAPLLGTEGALLKGSTAHMPTRPRKLSLPLLIACLVVRLEILQYVGKHQQCSTPGIEVRDPFDGIDFGAC